MQEFIQVDVDFWLWARKIAVSIICGAVVGAERQIRGKPAGIRTSILICMGTCCYIYTGVLMGDVPGNYRILGQVITGIGFLGAGVILTNAGMVKGITSAATIWMLASIGALIGYGLYQVSILMTFSTLSVLVGTELLENAFQTLRRGVHRRSAKPQNHADNS